MVKTLLPFIFLYGRFAYKVKWVVLSTLSMHISLVHMFSPYGKCKFHETYSKVGAKITF